MIEAILNGDTALALAFTVTHRTPVLALCRKLDDAGYGAEPMTVYRDGKPVLHISSIAAAAKRNVVENDKAGPRWGKFVPFTAFPASTGGEVLASEVEAATHVAEATP